jgi:nicotinate-nucleotide adenylyltransferase
MRDHDRPGAMGAFGGTFDPIHYGHLRTALELLEAVGFSEIRFLPAGNPPHRDGTHADAATRMSLVHAAIASEPRFVLDGRELRRAGPSYSVDTLSDLRAEFPERSISLIVGMDAFLGLAKWHRWERILDLAHLVVAHRPGWRPPDRGLLGDLLTERGTERGSELLESSAGRVYVRAVTQLEISSSAIRELVRSGRDPRFLVPDPVCRLLAELGCYNAATERN